MKDASRNFQAHNSLVNTDPEIAKIMAAELDRRPSSTQRIAAAFLCRSDRLRESAARAQAGRFQPNQSITPWPMTNSRSRPFSHGSSSVNIVTHWR